MRVLWLQESFRAICYPARRFHKLTSKTCCKCNQNRMRKKKSLSKLTRLFYKHKSSTVYWLCKNHSIRCEADTCLRLKFQFSFSVIQFGSSFSMKLYTCLLGTRKTPFTFFMGLCTVMFEMHYVKILVIIISICFFWKRPMHFQKSSNYISTFSTYSETYPTLL